MTALTDADFIRERGPDEETGAYVTTKWGMRGFFAVLMTYEDGYWDVWQSGIGSYKNAAEAAVEGRQWAEAEGLEFRP